MTDTGRIAALEARIAKLEADAVLFEEHRQATIRLNKQLKELDEQWEREKQERKQKELARSAKCGSKPLWEQFSKLKSPDERMVDMLARMEACLERIEKKLDRTHV